MGQNQALPPARLPRRVPQTGFTARLQHLVLAQRPLPGAPQGEGWALGSDPARGHERSLAGLTELVTLGFGVSPPRAIWAAHK